ncbi:MAG: hypothetical protein ABIQ74_03955 [Chitinophagales bacterium]
MIGFFKQARRRYEGGYPSECPDADRGVHGGVRQNLMQPALQLHPQWRCSFTKLLTSILLSHAASLRSFFSFDIAFTVRALAYYLYIDNTWHKAKRISAGDDGQVNTTDTESRSMPIHHKLVEVAYNIQCATDA